MHGNLSSLFLSPATVWPSDISPAIELNAAGLLFGAGTVLARMTKGGGLALDQDRERLLALLSVADRRAVSPDVLGPIKTASAHWQRGDKALANLRLVFSGLPTLDEPADAWRVRLAEILLDAGLPPRTLMVELELAPAANDLDKFGYNPNQPRVPAGNGRASGQWEAIWNRIISWLDEPVPEYDQDARRIDGFSVDRNQGCDVCQPHDPSSHSDDGRGTLRPAIDLGDRRRNPGQRARSQSF